MTVTITREDPRQPDVIRLVQDLDDYMAALYPAESNHLLDIETLARPEILFHVARRDGAAIGCAALWLRDGADYAEVKRVYVSPAARGGKLGAKLITILEAAARTAGRCILRLETGIHQPEARRLFLAAGFHDCGPFGDYPADDPLSVFMEKRLP